MKKTLILGLTLGSFALLSATHAPSFAQSVQGVVAPVTVPITTMQMTTGTSEAAAGSKLTAYVEALIEVDRLVRWWQPKIDNATTENDARALRAQTDAQIATAIERAPGISTREYYQIGQAALNDAALRAQVNHIFKVRSGN